MKRLVIDIDETISHATAGDYANAQPNTDVILKLKEYQAAGFEIVLFTSRNMRTFDNSIGKINARMLPVLFDWLARHDVPFDEIVTGKPWCGTEGFYVDDKAIRPNEFLSSTYDEIANLVGIEK